MARSQMGWRRSMWSSTCTASALVLSGLMVSGAIVLAQGPSGLGRPPTDAELSDSLVASGQDAVEIIRGMERELEKRLGKRRIDALRDAVKENWGEIPEIGSTAPRKSKRRS